MPPLRFGRVESPLGPMWIAMTDAGVAAISRSASLESFLAPLRRRFPDLEPIPAEIDLGWLRDDVRPALDIRGLPAFDVRVYDVVSSIPAGSTLTYGEVAAQIGSPRAARAVGGAMSRCPLFPAVPCHRVVRAADGWSGWGGDPLIKRRLLAAEARRSAHSHRDNHRLISRGATE
jgi:O-6-methylguanine DNA methyltransferase